MIKIFAYNQASESARLLADALDIYIIKHQGSRYRPRMRDTIINWGTGPQTFPRSIIDAGCEIVNHPNLVYTCSNKLRFFQSMDGDVAQYVPEWTTSKAQAMEWINDGKKVCGRHTLTGHSGQGLVIYDEDSEQVDDAPLYTKYIPKDSEYRLHYFKGVVIVIQQKKRQLSVPDDQVNWQIRNHLNGFVFSRQDVRPPQAVFDAGLAVFNKSGLDFGALDIVYNRRQDRAYVLEINTAPGIEGTTLQDYADAFKFYLGM